MTTENENNSLLFEMTKSIVNQQQTIFSTNFNS